MGEWTAGLAAFGLYFLYDWNRVYRKNGWMKPFFAAGSLLLAWVGLRLILSAWASGQRLWLAPAVLFLAGLIHTLFFALPFDDTYRREGGRAQGLPGGSVRPLPPPRNLVVFRLLYLPGPGLRGMGAAAFVPGTLGPESGIRLVPGPADFCERIFGL